MWLDHRKDGDYYRQKVKDPVTGKKKVVSVKVEGKSKTAYSTAQLELAQKVADISSVETQEGHRFSEVAKVYLKEQQATLRPSTVQRNTITLNTLQGILGDFYLDKVTAGYIREKLIATGKAPVTINQYIKRLNGFLRWAYKNDYMPSPAAYEKLSYLKDTPHRQKIADKFLEQDELTALLDGMPLPRWRLLTSFLALSGLRIGEAIALDRDDIDKGFIHVTKTVQINGHNRIGEAKTFSSIREVYIQPELADCLRQIDVAMSEQQSAFQYNDVPYLFVSPSGSRITYNAYKKYLADRSRAVLGRVITPHALRHTHTSLLAEQGVSLDVISRRLGHEDSSITREIYFHVTKRLKMADASTIAPIRLLATPEGTLDTRNPRKIKKVE